MVREKTADISPAATDNDIDKWRVRTLAAITQQLARIPGPVRDRHRADFIAMRDLAEPYRKVPYTDGPQIPDLKEVDWMAAGK